MTPLEQELNTILSDYGFEYVLGGDLSIELRVNRWAFSIEDIYTLAQKDFVKFTITEVDGVQKLDCNIQEINDGKIRACDGIADELLDWYKQNNNSFVVTGNWNE